MMGNYISDFASEQVKQTSSYLPIEKIKHSKHRVKWKTGYQLETLFSPGGFPTSLRFWCGSCLSAGHV